MTWIPIGLLVMASGWLAHRVTRDRRSVREAQGWKRTTGQVIGWCPPARDPRGELYVIYEYRVDGATFRSDRICAGLEHRRGARARERGQLYMEHSRVPVSYDPDNPRRACVEIGSDPDHRAPVLAAAFALVALLISL